MSDPPHLTITPESVRNFMEWGYFDKSVTARPRVLIAAGFGYGNLGDEAQVGAVISRWHRADPGCAITLLSPNPGYSQALHGERSIWAPRVVLFSANTSMLYWHDHSRNFFLRYAWVSMRLIFSAWMMRLGLPLMLCRSWEAELLSELSNQDVVHFSGGGYLTGMTRSRLWENCLLMRICRILRVPYMLTGQTIGVFKGWLDRHLARTALKGARLIHVRDRVESVAALAGIDIRGDHIKETCDDALLCPRADRETVQTAVTTAGADPHKPWMIVNFHHWGQDPKNISNIEETFASSCDALAVHLGLQPIFLAMTPGDLGAASGVLRRMKQPAFQAPYHPDYRVARGLIADANLVFTMKHHPIVFAQGESVPVICLALDDYYTHKNKGALDNTASGAYCVGTENFKPEQIVALAKRAFNERVELAGRMKDYVTTMRQLELTPYDQAVSYYRSLVTEN